MVAELAADDGKEGPGLQGRGMVRTEGTLMVDERLLPRLQSLIMAPKEVQGRGDVGPHPQGFRMARPEIALKATQDWPP